MLCWFFNLLSSIVGRRFWSSDDARWAVAWEKHYFGRRTMLFGHRVMLDSQKCVIRCKNTFFGYGLGYFWSQLHQTSFLDRISLENNIEAYIRMIWVDFSLIDTDKLVDLWFISLSLCVFFMCWFCTCIYFELMYICHPWRYIKLYL